MTRLSVGSTIRNFRDTFQDTPQGDPYCVRQDIRSSVLEPRSHLVSHRHTSASRSSGTSCQVYRRREPRRSSYCLRTSALVLWA